jgi:DNA-binding transcriptional regulator GbsR (MarR family)
MTDKSVLSAVQRRFILHWGEMGSRWGINRTVAQVHALLHISEQPVSAENIAAALGVARSNVSTSLRELQGWGIVRVAHLLGDRRDHFESLKDVWEMFRIIVDERKKREADPVLLMLREATAEAKKPGAADAYTRERLADMLQFFELMTTWCEHTRKLPTPAVVRMVKMGDKLGKLLG